MNRAETRREWRAHFRKQSPAQPRAQATAASTRRHGPAASGNVEARAACGLRIRIDELELHGVGRIDEGQVAAGLRSELAALIGARGVPRAWGRAQFLERADAGPIGQTQRVSAHWLGEQVGRTIYNLRSAERP
jgi:hypothetical protein